MMKAGVKDIRAYEFPYRKATSFNLSADPFLFSAKFCLSTGIDAKNTLTHELPHRSLGWKAFSQKIRMDLAVIEEVWP